MLLASLSFYPFVGSSFEFWNLLSQVKILQGDSVVQDEFVETQYYKEMDSIDKEHHTVFALDLLIFLTVLIFFCL